VRGAYNLAFVLKEINVVLIECQFYYSWMLVCSRRYDVLLLFLTGNWILITSEIQIQKKVQMHKYTFSFKVCQCNNMWHARGSYLLIETFVIINF